MVQHGWTYKPLVHDVLGMRLNQITVVDSAASSEASGSQQTFEVDDHDFFWTAHGRNPFPKVAEQIEVELAKYKAAVDEVNKAAGSEVVDPTGDPAEAMRGSTKGLMSALSSLPELTERKRSIDRHTNLATALLTRIKARALDRYYATEEECIGGKATGVEAVLKLLQADQPGTDDDKLRLALVWLLTSQTLPPDAECERVEASLGGKHVAAWAHVRRMRRLNLTGGGSTIGGSGASFSNAAQAQLSSLFEQGLSSLTKGVKNLLAGEQQAAVTVAVEALMEGRSNNPDIEGYAFFDPKVV